MDVDTRNIHQSGRGKGGKIKVIDWLNGLIGQNASTVHPARLQSTRTPPVNSSLQRKPSRRNTQFRDIEWQIKVWLLPKKNSAS